MPIRRYADTSLIVNVAGNPPLSVSWAIFWAKLQGTCHEKDKHEHPYAETIVGLRLNMTKQWPLALDWQGQESLAIAHFE